MATDEESKERIKVFRGILVAAATGQTVDGVQYEKMRNALLSNLVTANMLPVFVKECPDLRTYWNFIKMESPTYQGRRDFLKKVFDDAMRKYSPDRSLPSIFISHSSLDKFFVRKLAEQLKFQGVKVWLDEAEIKVGDSLTEKIGEAIRDTNHLGVVLSHNSVNSEWVQKELQIALQKEIKEGRVVVLPILIERVEIPPFLKDKRYADFTDPTKFDEAFRMLLSAIQVPETDIKTKETFVSAPEGQLSVRTTANTSAGSLLAQFSDVRITGLDEKRSKNPHPSKDLYNMVLTLSSQPPKEWQDIFNEERRFPRHLMWRDAWISGQSIVVYCVPEEIEKYHLKDLKEDVKNSNVKYREYIAELAQKEASEAKAEREFTSLKKRLKFD